MERIIGKGEALLQLVIGNGWRQGVTCGPKTIDLEVAAPRLAPRATGQAVVHPLLVMQCDTYREACRLAYYLRPGGMKLTHIAAATGMHAPHLTDYLGRDDSKSRRDMPARYIGRFQASVGNTAVTQWLAMAANLTIAEEHTHFGEY